MRLYDEIVNLASVQLQSCEVEIRVSLVVVVKIGNKMGCGVSKVDDLPLVVFCRERKDLIKAASDHRYALAVAHISYFRSLKDVGDALCRFVDEELVIASSSSASSPSSLSSPVITLPSDEGKGGGGSRQRRRKLAGSAKDSSPSTSISHSGSLEISRRNQSRNLHRKGEVEDGERGGHEHDDSHSHISSSEEESSSGHIQIEDTPEREKVPSPMPGITYSPNMPVMDYSHSYNPYYPYDNPYNAFDSSGYSYNTYYMKKSSAPIPSKIYEEPKSNPIYSHSIYNQSNQAYGNAGYNQSNQPYGNAGYNQSNQPYGNAGYNQSNQPYGSAGYNQPYENTGYFGFLNSLTSEQGGSSKQQQQEQKQQLPPTPPSPKVSAWDYLNPFEIFDNTGYHGHYENSRHGYGSDTSSPDSRELREREGIPDLEDETESEVIKEVYAEEKKQKKVAEEFTKSNRNNNNKNKNRNVHFAEGRDTDFGEGTSRGVPLQQQPGKAQQQQPTKAQQQPQQQQPHLEQPKKQKELHMEEDSQVEEKEVTNGSPNSDISIPSSAEEVFLEKKGVGLEIDGASQNDVESSKYSSLTTLSPHGIRDLREVVREIKNEFEAATDYGKEVCHLLEAGKLPYRSKGAVVRAIFSRMLLPVRNSASASQSQSKLAASSGSSVARMARAYVGDHGNGIDSPSLVSTLDKLYVWEKKLYKEVKDEERLRILYDKKCRKLKLLDDRGAETSKIEATQASIRKLLTRINVSIRSVDAIAKRIHELRDKELQPQLRELLQGLRRMWKFMLKCHQKQFQAILQSKTGTLRANISHRDSSVRATVELEMELLKWCNRFNAWVELQKSYVESLNGWLLKCVIDRPEETPDGPMPYSPGRIGAPPVFVICHDWKQAMDRISQSGVSQSVVQTAMNDFASSLHQLWQRQDEEQHQRQKAEYTLKDFEKQIRAIRLERAKMQNGQDSISDRGNLPMVSSDNGLSAFDDLKVDLDSMKQRVKEERVGHKNAIKLVNAAVSRSIQEGLVPIFEALESFTSEAAKAYDHVRVNGASDNQ